MIIRLRSRIGFEARRTPEGYLCGRSPAYRFRARPLGALHCRKCPVRSVTMEAQFEFDTIQPSGSSEALTRDRPAEPREQLAPV